MEAAKTLSLPSAWPGLNRPVLVPQAGASIYEWQIGANCTIQVEYEFEAGERGSMNPDAANFGPSTPDRVTVIGLLVNGYWIDPGELMGDEAVESLEAKILEAR